jgi:hypothetical protein
MSIRIKTGRKETHGLTQNKMIWLHVVSYQEVRKALAGNRRWVMGTKNKFKTFHPLIHVKQKATGNAKFHHLCRSHITTAVQLLILFVGSHDVF